MATEVLWANTWIQGIGRINQLIGNVKCWVQDWGVNTRQAVGSCLRLSPGSDLSVVNCSPSINWMCWLVWWTEWISLGPCLQGDTAEALKCSFSRINFTGIYRRDWNWEKLKTQGNGNPLQCSCLENPRDGGAWWAAIYGVAQSRTWLRRLSSSRRHNTKLLL